MSNIPNVSAIYRDLSHLSESAGFSKQNQPPDYSLEGKKINQKNSFMEMYEYKQKRHNQLMNRLQNSYQQNRQLLSEGGESMHQTIINNMRSPNYSAQPSNSQHQTKWSGSSFRNSNFVMPKIKYRHVEDSMKRKTEQKLIDSTLQRQFYEDTPEQSEPAKMERVSYGVNTRNKQQNQELLERESMQSNGTGKFSQANRASKNSKYEEKLESYYELCRKNMAYKDLSPKKQTEEKFVRAGMAKKKPLHLDEAVRILSLD